MGLKIAAMSRALVATTMRILSASFFPRIGVVLPRVLFVVAAPGFAHAATCGGATQAALGQCAETRRVAADARLNDAFGQVVTRLQDPDDQRQRDALKDAENVWIRFRDAECRFETAGSYGGSINSMQLADCATRLSDARARTLGAMAACHARDGSCVLGP